MQKIRINEATLKKIIYESTKKVLQEISPELKAAAALTAADKARKNQGNTLAKNRYANQASRFARSAEEDYASQNPLWRSAKFNPYNRTLDATFNGGDSEGNTVQYYDRGADQTPGVKGVYGNQSQYNPYVEGGYYDQYPEEYMADNLSDRDLRRLERFKGQYNDARSKLNAYNTGVS